MARTTNPTDRDLAKRHIVGALNHDDAYLVYQALGGYAATLRAVASRMSTADTAQLVRDAERADALSAIFRDANVARDFIEEAGLSVLASELAG